MKAFFDTNVLVYTATSDARKQRSVDCLGRGGVVSVQVLNEGDRAAREALKFSPRDPLAAIYCGVAAYCQYIGRNYAEAIRLSREALRQRSDFVGAHRVLTASLGMAGSTDAATSGGSATAGSFPYRACAHCLQSFGRR